MARSLRSAVTVWALLAATAIGVALLGACAPKDQRLTPRDSDVKAESMGSDLELTRHLLMQLGHARQMMKTALTEELTFRATAKVGYKTEDKGCHSLKKLFPEPSDKQVAATEIFSVVYRQCDDATGSPRSKLHELNGGARYTVTYRKALPSSTSNDLTMGLPDSVTVESFNPDRREKGKDTATAWPEMEYELGLKFDDKVNVGRTFSFHVNLVSEDEKTGTYRGTMDVYDNVTSNVGKELRLLKSQSHLKDIEFVVGKVPDQDTYLQVTSMRVGEMSIALQGTKQTKSDFKTERATLSPAAKLEAGLTISDSASYLQLASDVCDVASGSFKVRNTVTSTDTLVQVADGQLKTSSAADGAASGPKLKICSGDQQDPVFTESLEGMYL